MNHPQTTMPPNIAPAPPMPKRPGTVLAMIVAAVLSALSGAVGAIIVFAGGRELADANTTDVFVNNPEVFDLPGGMTLEETKELAGPLWDMMIDDRATSMAVRGGMVLFCAVLMVLFALLARKAAVWARVFVTVFAVVSWLPYTLIIGDYEPTGVTALSGVAAALALAAVVLCWLPANNRYAKALKTRR